MLAPTADTPRLSTPTETAPYESPEWHPAFEECCNTIFELGEDGREVIETRIADRLEMCRPAVSEMNRSPGGEGHSPGMLGFLEQAEVTPGSTGRGHGPSPDDPLPATPRVVPLACSLPDR